MTKKRAAQTVDSLGGGAPGRVDFIRTDARAVKRAAVSNTQLKDALGSPFEMPKGLAGPKTTDIIRSLMAICVSGRPAPGVVIGLGAVSRRLRRGELRALVVAREAQPAMALAHLPVLATTLRGARAFCRSMCAPNGWMAAT